MGRFGKAQAYIYKKAIMYVFINNENNKTKNIFLLLVIIFLSCMVAWHLWENFYTQFFDFHNNKLNMVSAG